MRAANIGKELETDFKTFTDLIIPILAINQLALG